MGIFVYNGIFKNITGGSYDGEKIPGDLDQWNVLSGDSNLILDSTYGILSDRSATLYHTTGPARGAINKQSEYAIGPGLVFRSQPDWNNIPWLKRDKAKDWGKEFQKIVNFYFQEFNFYEKQAVLFRGALVNGDSLLFFIRQNSELTDLVEFAGNQIDYQYNTKNEDEAFTLGIKHDDLLRRLGIKKIDGKTIDFKNENDEQNLVQFYIKELPRQLRGYPLVYSVINLAKNDDRHHDATTHRAVMESIILGNYETDATDPVRQTKNMAEANIKKAVRGNFVTNTINKIANSFKMGAGNIYTMRKGEKVNFSDLKTPSNTFGLFKEWMINYIGAATGTPPEVILSKYSTSYTAHRGALNDFKKSYMNKRFSFIRNVMQPVIKEIARDAIFRGYIKAPGFFDNPMIQRAYLQGNFLGPVPGVINPLQEINAAVRSVENAFELRSDIASRFGNEWDNFIEEWHENEREYKGLDDDSQNEKIIEDETNKGGEDA